MSGTSLAFNSLYPFVYADDATMQAVSFGAIPPGAAVISLQSGLYMADIEFVNPGPQDLYGNNDSYLFRKNYQPFVYEDDAAVISPLNTGAYFVQRFSGVATWSGSGASLAFSVPGVLSTDVVQATIKHAPTQAAYLVSATPSTNTITFTLSAANTSNDATIQYSVSRAPL